jgi:hypothetical protein
MEISAELLTQKELDFIEDFKKILEKHSCVIGRGKDGDAVILNDYFDSTIKRIDEIYLYLNDIANKIGFYEEMEQS